MREGIKKVISQRGLPDREMQVERAISVVGRYGSGSSDVSNDHDRHLAEFYR